MRYLVVVILALCAATVLAQPAVKTWTFEDTAIGGVPDGWKIEATRRDGPLATWEVFADDEADKGKNVFAMTRPNHACPSTYNLCWTDAVPFKDGVIKVKMRADSGLVDRGGGPAWRVRDADNYYVCRANPLESNLRLYYVKDGVRIQLATADLDIPSGKWLDLEIRQKGTHIECSLDGKKLIEMDDATLSEAGGVGLWTKADAMTSFDVFQVETLESAK